MCTLNYFSRLSAFRLVTLNPIDHFLLSQLQLKTCSTVQCCLLFFFFHLCFASYIRTRFAVSLAPACEMPRIYMHARGKENSPFTPLPSTTPAPILSTSPHKQQHTHTHIESGRESEKYNQTFGFYSICSISIYVNVLCLCGQSKCKCCYKLIKIKINIFSKITKENKTKVNNSSDEMGRKVGSSEAEGGQRER